MNAVIRIFLLSALLSLFTQSSVAREDFLEAWKQRYPNSASSERGCQLCHQRVEGGNGWNSYGITIRFAFLDIFGGFAIDPAFVHVEQENADGDAEGLSNIVEIERGLDPGWVAGPNNLIDFNDGLFLENQLPPFDDVDGVGIANDDETFCFPIQTKGRVVLVCF